MDKTINQQEEEHKGVATLTGSKVGKPVPNSSSSLEKSGSGTANICSNGEASSCGKKKLSEKLTFDWVFLNDFLFESLAEFFSFEEVIGIIARLSK